MKTMVRKLPATACAVALLGSAAHAGPYVTLGLTFASDEIGAITSGVNHPTRCDRELYTDPSMASTDAACTDNTVRTFLSDSFDLGGAFAGSARFRIRLGCASDRGGVSEPRARGWGSPAEQRGRQPGVAGQDFGVEPARSTLSQGLGFQLEPAVCECALQFRYRLGLVTLCWGSAPASHACSRTTADPFCDRTLADGYVEAVGGDPAHPEDWQVAAAGSSSVIDTQVSDKVFGYQIIAGVERGLTEGTSLFLAVRWSRIDDVSGEDVWDTIRSHRPVQADGVTPFTSIQDLRDIGGYSATVGLKYEF